MFVFMIVILMYWLLIYIITWHMQRNVIDQEVNNLFFTKSSSFPFLFTAQVLSFKSRRLQFVFLHSILRTMIFQVFQFYEQEPRNGYLTYSVTLFPLSFVIFCVSQSHSSWTNSSTDICVSFLACSLLS
jgi:hypothetical protein